MNPIPSKTLCLQTRDKKLFYYLLRVRIASINQIKRDLQLEQDRTTLCKRLGKLVDYSYLNKDWVLGRAVYSLGKKGISYLYDEGDIQKRYQPAYLGYKGNQAEHDYLLNEVYGRILSIPIVRELKTANEHLLKHDQLDDANIPDGTFYLHDSKKPWVLELELCRKSSPNYEQIFYRYFRDMSIVGVAYLVEHEADIRTLKALENKLQKRDKSRFFFAKIEDFLFDPIDTSFRSSDGRIFSFYINMTKERDRELESQTKLEKLTTPSTTYPTTIDAQGVQSLLK